MKRNGQMPTIAIPLQHALPKSHDGELLQAGHEIVTTSAPEVAALLRLKAVAFVAMVATACAGQNESNAGLGKDWTYPMTATIVSRDPTKNSVNLSNEEVPGVMAKMTMDYEVRGAKVGALPPDGTPVDVTVHDREGAYYITNVKAKR